MNRSVKCKVSFDFAHDRFVTHYTFEFMFVCLFVRACVDACKLWIGE